MFNFFPNNTKLPDRSIDEIKQICHILFIDDQKFEVVNILKKSGWINTKSIKDVDSLDDSDIKRSHILFIDIQGVGKTLKFKDEGLGLIVALKRKYPDKKIIVYSAESTGDRFHEGLSIADSRLSKNADPYEFQNLVEQYSKEAFSLNECIDRIQEVLKTEIGYSLSTDEIAKKLKKVYQNKSFDNDSVSKIFNISNAANLSTILQLFLTAK